MDGTKLATLVSRRLATLNRLHEIGARQIDAIQGGRMSELMRILSEKQSPLNELSSIAEQLRAASADDPAARQWESQAQREQCRLEQETCERLHLDLLAIEAECEAALQQSRLEVEQEVRRIDGAKQAVTQYSSQDSVSRSGDRLDLASD